MIVTGVEQLRISERTRVLKADQQPRRKLEPHVAAAAALLLAKLPTLTPAHLRARLTGDR